jgi:hypothetical protein
VRLGEGLEGRVVDVKPTGAETFFVVEVAGTEVTAVAKQRLTLSPGDRVRVMLKSPWAHQFDVEDNSRLSPPSQVAATFQRLGRCDCAFLPNVADLQVERLVCAIKWAHARGTNTVSRHEYCPCRLDLGMS